MGDDLADWLQEAQVQHLVGFVEHEDLGRGKVGDLFLQVVDQTAGGCHQNIDAAGQGAHLRAVFHAAVDEGDGEAQVFAIGAEAFGDLAGQFAGGR